MSTVRSGVCNGGPRNGKLLATLSPGRVPHPDDTNGFYVHAPAKGPTPSGWTWIATNRKEPTK